MNINSKYKFNMKGWFNESWRHMLAAKGIKTKPVRFMMTKRDDRIDDAEKNLTESQIEEAKRKVLERTGYGIRHEIVEKPSYRFIWSNASENWWVAYGHGKIKPETVEELDANEVIIPAKTEIEAEAIKKHLPMLPLYALSTEAQERKLIDPQKARDLWFKKQMVKNLREEYQEENK
jgi:hypothetical protein